MRCIQLHLEDDIDDALTAEAARLRTSRSELVRDAVRSSLKGRLDRSPDAVDELVGSLEVEPDDDINSVIYGLGT